MAPTPLPLIDSTAWEHPADRAALNSMRALPGFDEVVRKIAGFISERGARHFFTADAVRVGPRQRPKLDALYTEVLATFDWQVRPQLYVSQTPIVNAGAYGFEDPFIVVNSGMLGLLDREEQRFVLAHELGHVISGHTTYSTIAVIIMTLGLRSMPFLAGIALLPFELALLEWYRKAEFSADRAGLLGVQDPRTAAGAELKMTGGSAGDDTIDIDAFLAQASEYETEGGVWDKMLKLMNTAFRTHPFGTVRAAELARWSVGEQYKNILAGTYARRGDPKPPLGDDVSEAASYYRDNMKAAADEVTAAVSRAKDAFSQAWNKRSGTGSA